MDALLAKAKAIPIPIAPAPRTATVFGVSVLADRIVALDIRLE